MKKILLLALGVLFGTLAAANAQVVTKQPTFAATNSWVDLANGPTEILPFEGNGVVYTASGGAGVTGTSAGTTALTLSGTPGVAPCIGCLITCAPTNTAACSIPANTTVTAYNGTTGVTTSANTTVTAASLTWGAACPTSGAPLPPSSTNAIGAPIMVRTSATSPTTGIPMYTQARICVYGGQQAGLTLVNFPIGAH